MRQSKAIRQSKTSTLSHQKAFSLKFFDQQINSQKLQPIIQQNIQQGRYSQTIPNSFRFLGMVDKYQQTHDIATQQLIKDSFHNNLLHPQLAQKEHIPFQIINPTKNFWMRKVGNITSKEVEREVRFIKEGIVQLEGNKLLNISSVLKIEKKSQGKLMDIAWIKDSKTYPYRVVLKDNKSLLRAVFAESETQAKQILDFCIIHLRKFNNLHFTITQAKKNLRDNILSLAQRNMSFISKVYTTKQTQMSRQISIQKHEAQEVELAIKSQRKNEVTRQFLQNGDKSLILKLLNEWEYLSSSTKLRGGDEPSVGLSRRFIAPPSSAQEPVPNLNNSGLQKSIDFIENFTLIFQRFQLLKEVDIMRKPILQIKIIKGNDTLYEQIFETILEKKNPNLIYLLFCENPNLKQVSLEEQFNKLEIEILVRDQLTTQINQARIRLRAKERVNQLLYLATQDGTIRLQVRYRTSQQAAIDERKEKLINEDGLVLICKELAKEDIDIIKRQFWSEQNKNQYYSQEISLDITQILGRLQVVPKFWWFGVSEEEYQILSLLQAASQSLHFILMQSHLHMTRALMKIFQSSDKISERVFKSLLSIIIYYIKPFFSSAYFDKVQNVHKLIGMDVNCDLPSKLSLQLNAFIRILQKESEQLMERFKHKNVHLGLICYQFLYQLYSRNFNIRLLTSIWNYLFKFPQLIQQNLILIGVTLIKINSEALSKAYRYPQIITILTENTKEFTNFNYIIAEIQSLRKRYFTKPDSVIKTITYKLLQQNPFQIVINNFYKKQNSRLGNNSTKKFIQKKKQIQKLMKAQPKYQYQLPKYTPKTHNLHLYFHKIPDIQGALLSIRINNVQHQCINARFDSYFLVRKVNSPVQIILTYQGRRWIKTAELIQGIHYASLELVDQKNPENVLTIQYTGGYLTQSQEVAILRGKPSDHYLGSYMKFQDLVNECSREVNDSYFIKSLQNNRLPHQITQGIKFLFTSGSNRFNDIDFYLSWILELKISPVQKLQQLKLYAETLWTELFHSPSSQLYKILFREFLEKMNFPIEDGQFEFLYNGAVAEFDCPRVISFKFINHDSKKIKLDKHLQRFISQKSSRYLLSDIIVSHQHLFSLVLENLRNQKLTTIDGILVLKYSSYGLVKKKIIPLRYSKQMNELIINTQHDKYTPGTYHIADTTPQLLVSDSYPSFSRISNRLFNEQSQISFLKSKFLHGQLNSFQKQKQSDILNVIGCLEDKLKCVIPLRYRKECFTMQLPFYSYFSELMYKISYPELPKVYLNRVQVTANKICTFNGELQLSDNQRGQNLPVNKRLGLHGNISKWNLQTPIVYFWPLKKQQSFKNQYPVFVNYGQGVFRTEHCKVNGYCHGSKNRSKLFFIIELHGKSTLIPREELLVNNIDIFPEVDLNSQKYEGLKKVVKEYEGKTRDEKEAEITQSMKFTNVVKKSSEFYQPKGLGTYMKTFEKI